MTEPRIYRASSLGYSLEQLVAPHLGFEPIPPPEWLQEKFDEGTALEPIVLLELRQLGWQIQDHQLEPNSEGDFQIEVILEVIPDVATVRGHVDALGTFGAGSASRVIEVKSMAEKSFAEASRSAWDTPGLIQRYKWQLSAYMLATGLPAVMVVCSKGEGGVNNLLYMYADEPFYLISDIAQKISEAEKYIADGVIPEGCTDYPCPYFYLHGEKVQAEQADKDLDALMAAWLESNRKKKVYADEEASLRGMIVEYVGQEGKAKVRGSNGVTVSVSWQEGGESTVTRQPKWVTTVSPPRKSKDA